MVLFTHPKLVGPDNSNFFQDRNKSEVLSTVLFLINLNLLCFTHHYRFFKNSNKICTKYSSVCVVFVCLWAGVLAVLLLYEGVRYSLHAVLRTDEHYRGPSADHQAQLPGVFCQLQLVIWIWGDNHGHVINTWEAVSKKAPCGALDHTVLTNIQH